MGKITALRYQEHRRDRVNVWIDDEYAFSLQGILAMSLHRGQELSAKDIDALRKRDAVETAYDAALNYLSFRPRSEKEIERYLSNRELDPEQVEQTLARLKQARFVDDEQFARFWVESREMHRPRGRRALRSELAQKGVSSEVVNQALENVDEEKQAFEAARRIMHRLERLEKPDFYRRLLGHLQRRGFAYGICMTVAGTLWHEISEQTRDSD